ncbi:cache domain-containing protein [uncultured Desulfosarcina sp.]|uniref:cache domain-containing protein n=1 Tax=uncultured Desulfosarcina sp. TaxID=218289 RepID=UPI0029C98C89|nr:cache domain-containing protein [uncultured Desulfosarcina sp.]
MRKFAEFALPAFLVVALFGITVFFFILPRLEATILASRQSSVRELVRSIEYLLNTYQEDVDNGLLDLAEAQNRALRRIRSFRYGIDMDNYFWVSDLKGRFHMHPIRPDLVNQDFDTITDPQARQFLQKSIDVATRQKSGFIEYMWKNRPDETRTHSKLAYVSLFEPWKWVIGSGLYYDDVRDEIAALTRDLTLVGIGVLLFSALLSGYLTWRGLIVRKEQRRAEKALQQSEMRFRNLFMMSPVPMILVDRKIGIVEVNEQFTQIVGYTRDDLSIRGKWWELAYPDPVYRQSAISAWQTAVHDTLENNTIVEPFENNVACKDGRTRTMLTGASTIEKNILVSFLDITDRKEEESERRKNLELLKATFNATPDGMLAITSKGGIIHANQKFYEMWRIPESLRQDTNIINYLKVVKNQLKNPEILRDKFEVLYRGNSINHFSEILFKDGSVFERFFSPIILNEEELGSVWYFRDVTERKKSEAERQELQEQFLQSQKLEAVGILAGGVAHDFNNMLGAIIGYAEMGLEKDDLSETAHKYFGRILDAGQRSASLTRQLLAFARKQTVSPKVMDLSTLVAGMLNMLRRLIGENIELVWQPANTPCTVKMDPGQLDQILANLCVNAKDAISEAGVITITTTLTTFDEATCASYLDCDPGKYVQLTVSDNGCGMDKETAARIFEPFFTTKGLGRGTGLGLSTIYGIVKQNKGFIKLYSEPDTGSTFKIFFPYHAGDAVEEIARPDEDLPKSHGETILLVEDDPILQEICEIMLRDLGYTILSAGTPGEAIKLAEENRDRIQLLITDVIMPEMNGPELAARLIAIVPETKHLYMSGYTANIIASQGLLDDNVNFIQKPFSLSGLALKVRQILDDEA